MKTVAQILKKTKVGDILIANTGNGRSGASYEAWTASDDWSGEPAMYGKLGKYDRSQSPWELVRLILEAIRLEKHKPETDKSSLAQSLKARLFR